MRLIIDGGDVVLPDGVRSAATVVIEDGRIADIRSAPVGGASGDQRIEARGCLVVPGFVDVHVHGVDGDDALDGPGALRRIAAALPRFGVTAFCPTTVACGPDALRLVLDEVRALRESPVPGSARVLPAHLESNFIEPSMRGAQPAEHLRLPDTPAPGERYAASEILQAMADHRAEIGIVTLAPELTGGFDLIQALSAAGHRVSLGHSAADFDLAHEAFDAGARHVTHLFNRMAPLTARAPGLAGAALVRDDVYAELVCDGYHVHPALGRIVLASKGADRVMAITDGTAVSGLPPGACGRLGGRQIRAGERAALLDDGTLAGSTATMDSAFRLAITLSRDGPVAAATMCASAPARALGLVGRGIIAAGMAADLAVLDQDLRVRCTCIDGRIVYTRPSS